MPSSQIFVPYATNDVRALWVHEPRLVGARTALSARTWLSALRFMGRLHVKSLDVHWDHESPTGETAPPRCCRQDAGSTLRFMESPLGLATAHWDHEPCQLVGRGVLTAPQPGGLRTARPTVRFMQRMRGWESHGSSS